MAVRSMAARAQLARAAPPPASFIFVLESANTKLMSRRRLVAATYASIEGTCPDSCALKKTRECYAMGGQVGMVTERIHAKRAPIEHARAEADAIDAADPRDRYLRLHVSGDASVPRAAQLLGAAARRWLERGGRTVWTYTHAWATVPRESWGPSVSVLASVDKLAHVAAAFARGYAVARYVAAFPADSWEEAGMTWIACPAQTRDDTGCVDCRLCMDAEGLRARKRGIAFVAHGHRGEKLKRRLQVLQTGVV